MKIISEKKSAKVVLSNKDVVEIFVSDENYPKMEIKCLGNTLHIEEDVDVFHDRLEEEKAIEAMNKYLKKREKKEKSSKKAKEIKKSS